MRLLALTVLGLIILSASCSQGGGWSCSYRFSARTGGPRRGSVVVQALSPIHLRLDPAVTRVLMMPSGLYPVDSCATSAARLGRLDPVRPGLCSDIARGWVASSAEVPNSVLGRLRYRQIESARQGLYRHHPGRVRYKPRVSTPSAEMRGLRAQRALEAV